MRIEDSREASLLNAAMVEYLSFETTKQGSEFDILVAKMLQGKKRGYALSVCIVLIAISAIVSAVVIIGKKTERNGSKSRGIQIEPQSSAPAPGLEKYAGVGPITAWASSPLALVVEPATPPLFSPLSSIISAPVIHPSSALPSLDLAPYEPVYNKTINRVDCFNMLQSNPKGNLKEWTVIAMEEAERALNESYILAKGRQLLRGSLCMFASLVLVHQILVSY